MIVKLKWAYAQGEYDTRTMKLTDVPAEPIKHEKDAALCIENGGILAIASLHLGDIESSNALCAEIVRRFNEFPEELKR